jgi:hypothetical protein
MNLLSQAFTGLVIVESLLVQYIYFRHHAGVEACARKIMNCSKKWVKTKQCLSGAVFHYTQSGMHGKHGPHTVGSPKKKLAEIADTRGRVAAGLAGGGPAKELKELNGGGGEGDSLLAPDGPSMADGFSDASDGTDDPPNVLGATGVNITMAEVAPQPDAASKYDKVKVADDGDHMDELENAASDMQKQRKRNGSMDEEPPVRHRAMSRQEEDEALWRQEMLHTQKERATNTVMLLVHSQIRKKMAQDHSTLTQRDIHNIENWAALKIQHHYFVHRRAVA